MVLVVGNARCYISQKTLLQYKLPWQISLLKEAMLALLSQTKAQVKHLLSKSSELLNKHDM